MKYKNYPVLKLPDGSLRVDFRSQKLDGLRDIHLGGQRHKTFRTMADLKTFIGELDSFISENGRQYKNLGSTIAITDKLKYQLIELKKHEKTLEEAVQYYLDHLNIENTINESQTLKKLMTLYLEKKFSNTLKPISREAKNNKKVTGKILIKSLGDYPIRKIQKTDIESILEKMDVSNITKQTYLTHFNAFFNYWVEEKVIDENPSQGIKIDVPNKLPDCYSNEEVKTFFKTLIDNKNLNRLIPYFAVHFFAGCRPSETADLTWDSFDFENSSFKILDGKTGSRVLKMMPNLKQWLQWFKSKFPHSPLIPDTKSHVAAQEPLKIKLKELNLRFIVSGGRHCFCTNWLAVHKNIFELEYYMGNSKRIQLNHYRGLTPTEEKGKEYFDISPDSLSLTQTIVSQNIPNVTIQYIK